jgi:hypothetical protein
MRSQHDGTVRRPPKAEVAGSTPAERAIQEYAINAKCRQFCA